jgi:hypothetical protein
MECRGYFLSVPLWKKGRTGCSLYFVLNSLSPRALYSISGLKELAEGFVLI